MKLFTLEEAQGLVPVLESLLKRGIEGKQEAEKIHEELQRLSQRIFMSGGMHIDVGKVARQRTEMDAHVQRAKDAVEEIDAIGVQVKDMDTGLLDFPCKVDDEVVLLCWKMGEAKITHWHTVESGFQDGSRWMSDLKGVRESRSLRSRIKATSRSRSPRNSAPRR